MMPLARFVRTTPFFVIAHRGASGVAPENTLASLRRAIDGGATMVELDVQLSSDKHLMVFHDSILGRTTNGHGHVRNHTADELRTLDAGSWFSADFANERIPFLHEAIALLKDHAYINIELKPLHESPDAELETKALVDLVHATGIGPTMCFSSFDHRTLAMVKHHDPLLHTVALNMPGDRRPPSEVVASCKADAYGCGIHEMTHSRAKDAHAHGIPCGVYTVNTEEHLRLALSFGVNAVVSNHPDLITSLYRSLAPHA
jgi:glycerophosphoryl diester phosphodiesterase